VTDERRMDDRVMDDRIVDDSVLDENVTPHPSPLPAARGEGAVAKIVGMAALLEWVRETRARGETIAFANGCFDILHVGHVRYLRASAEEADRLIVALNDDKSVEQLKGAGRPILSAAARAELVAALGCVDRVTVFSETTVADLLRAIRPDVHCKGTDYTVDSVPERQVVLDYGGRTAIVGDPKNHSTRDLLKQIAATGPSATNAHPPA
jgi:rfaE bifunctional protein nucleotidyltransferase chain/domain